MENTFCKGLFRKTCKKRKKKEETAPEDICGLLDIIILNVINHFYADDKIRFMFTNVRLLAVFTCKASIRSTSG